MAIKVNDSASLWQICGTAPTAKGLFHIKNTTLTNNNIAQNSSDVCNMQATPYVWDQIEFKCHLKEMFYGFFPKTGSKTEPTFTSQTAAGQPRQLTQILKKDLGKDNFDFFFFSPTKK